MLLTADSADWAQTGRNLMAVLKSETNTENVFEKWIKKVLKKCVEDLI